MAKIHKLMVGESLVGDGNEVAHIDLIIGPRGSAAESAFANALSITRTGSHPFSRSGAQSGSQAPHGLVQQSDDQGRQAGGADVRPRAAAVAKAVADSVADGTIPAAEADDVFICVGVFIHWDAADDKKIPRLQLSGRRIDRAGC
jgi:5,6,7,8-tetrahydromethanopterin hydro-lyase